MGSFRLKKQYPINVKVTNSKGHSNFFNHSNLPFNQYKGSFTKLRWGVYLAIKFWTDCNAFSSCTFYNQQKINPVIINIIPNTVDCSQILNCSGFDALRTQPHNLYYQIKFI